MIIKINHAIKKYDLLFMKHCEKRKLISIKNVLHMMIKIIHNA